MISKHLPAGLMTIFLLWNVSPSSAIEKSDLPADQEQQTLQMVDRHLPELTKMLAFLRTNTPREYERAIRDLNRKARRLAFSRERGEAFFENELRVIKIETQVDLATAKLRLNDDVSLRKQLRENIVQLQRLKVERLRLERELIEKRISKLNSQLESIDQRIEELDNNEALVAEQAYRIQLRRARRLNGANKTNPSDSRKRESKPAAPPATSSDIPASDKPSQSSSPTLPPGSPQS